jgi:hypothetical protein
VTTPASLEVAVAAAKEVGIQPQGILLIGTGDVCTKGHPSVDAMVSKGLQHELAFVEPRLAPGEAKQKVQSQSSCKSRAILSDARLGCVSGLLERDHRPSQGMTANA